MRPTLEIIPGVTFLLLALTLLSASGCARRSGARVDYASNKNAAIVRTESGEAATLSCPVGMVLVPSGPALFGPTEEKNQKEASAEERINVRAFCVDKYEWPNQAGEPPMRSVAWLEASNLCRGKGKQLCSEYEFEKACRGPSGTLFTYGDGYVDKGCAGAGDDYGLGQFTNCVSGFGVHDMSGGVYEWTSSGPNSGTTDESASRIVRGGMTAASPEKSARCTYRVRYTATASSREIGFRCCTAPQKDVLNK